MQIKQLYLAGNVLGRLSKIWVSTRYFSNVVLGKASYNMVSNSRLLLYGPSHTIPDIAWVSGLPMGEGGGGEAKGRPDTKPFSESCDTSKIWMWHWLDNTQYPLTSPTARAIGKEKPLKFFIDVLISCYRYVILLWTETQRGIQKGSGGRSQVLSWNKIKPEQELCFEGLVV